MALHDLFVIFCVCVRVVTVKGHAWRGCVLNKSVNHQTKTLTFICVIFNKTTKKL